MLQSSPVYTLRKEGPCIVAGGAPRVWLQLARACTAYGEIPVIGINHMAAMLGGLCFACVTVHGEDVALFGRAGHPVHVYLAAGIEPKMTAEPAHIWRAADGVAWGAGSSALPAALIAKAMGFAPVILCGVDVAATGYCEGYPDAEKDREFNRMDPNLVAFRREWWERAKSQGYLRGVVTAGDGWLREFLGGLDA